MAQIPKGRLVKGPYKPICRECAIYFSITVDECHVLSFVLFVWECLGEEGRAWCQDKTKSWPVGLRWISCQLHFRTHTIHEWYIYLQLVHVSGKCRYIYYTWVVWGNVCLGLFWPYDADPWETTNRYIRWHSTIYRFLDSKHTSFDSQNILSLILSLSGRDYYSNPSPDVSQKHRKVQRPWKK